MPVEQASRIRRRSRKRIVRVGSARDQRAPACPRATISPPVDDRDAVGQVLRLVHVVRGEEDRLAQRLQAADHLPGAAPRRRVEAGRRLVQEQQVGVAREADARRRGGAAGRRRVA